MNMPRKKIELSKAQSTNSQPMPAQPQQAPMPQQVQPQQYQAQVAPAPVPTRPAAPARGSNVEIVQPYFSVIQPGQTEPLLKIEEVRGGIMEASFILKDVRVLFASLYGTTVYMNKDTGRYELVVAIDGTGSNGEANTYMIEEAYSILKNYFQRDASPYDCFKLNESEHNPVPGSWRLKLSTKHAGSHRNQKPPHDKLYDSHMVPARQVIEPGCRVSLVAKMWMRDKDGQGKKDLTCHGTLDCVIFHAPGEPLIAPNALTPGLLALGQQLYEEAGGDGLDALPAGLMPNQFQQFQPMGFQQGYAAPVQPVHPQQYQPVPNTQPVQNAPYQPQHAGGFEAPQTGENQVVDYGD